LNMVKNRQSKESDHRYLGWIVAGIWILIVSSFIWYQWFHVPFPNDKQMIEHLNTHRTEYEYLVNGYRNHRERGVFYHTSSEEVLQLMKKLGTQLYC
jgi:hypothetical protein